MIGTLEQDLPDDLCIRFVGRGTTARLARNSRNLAKAWAAVELGNLVPTSDPFVFKVPTAVEKADELATARGRKRARLTPLVRASAEGGGRAVTSDDEGSIWEAPAA